MSIHALYATSSPSGVDVQRGSFPEKNCLFAISRTITLVPDDSEKPTAPALDRTTIRFVPVSRVKASADTEKRINTCYPLETIGYSIRLVIL